MKITKAVGNGQTQCRGCKEKGKWNVQWTDFLFKVEGKDGCYCKECVAEIRVEEKIKKFIGE